MTPWLRETKWTAWSAADAALWLFGKENNRNHVLCVGFIIYARCTKSINNSTTIQKAGTTRSQQFQCRPCQPWTNTSTSLQSHLVQNLGSKVGNYENPEPQKDHETGCETFWISMLVIFGLGFQIHLFHSFDLDLSYVISPYLNSLQLSSHIKQLCFTHPGNSWQLQGCTMLELPKNTEVWGAP